MRTTTRPPRTACTTWRSSTRSGASATRPASCHEFEGAAAGLSSVVGELIIVDDDDERLVLTGTGSFHAEVIPEDAQGEWRPLNSTDELVEFYDPTDVFGDLADSLAEAYPSVAPELAADAEGDGSRRWRRTRSRTPSTTEAEAESADDDGAEDEPTA